MSKTPRFPSQPKICVLCERRAGLEPRVVFLPADQAEHLRRSHPGVCAPCPDDFRALTSGERSWKRGHWGRGLLLAPGKPQASVPGRRRWIPGAGWFPWPAHSPPEQLTFPGSFFARRQARAPTPRDWTPFTRSTPTPTPYPTPTPTPYPTPTPTPYPTPSSGPTAPLSTAPTYERPAIARSSGAVFTLSRNQLRALFGHKRKLQWVNAPRQFLTERDTAKHRCGISACTFVGRDRRYAVKFSEGAEDAAMSNALMHVFPEGHRNLARVFRVFRLRGLPGVGRDIYAIEMERLNTPPLKREIDGRGVYWACRHKLDDPDAFRACALGQAPKSNRPRDRLVRQGYLDLAEAMLVLHSTGIDWGRDGHSGNIGKIPRSRRWAPLDYGHSTTSGVYPPIPELYGPRRRFGWI